MLHGDDTVNQGFYDSIETLFSKSSKASAAFCRCNYINAKGVVFGETKLDDGDSFVGMSEELSKYLLSYSVNPETGKEDHSGVGIVLNLL